jgi:hypothetical protein
MPDDFLKNPASLFDVKGKTDPVHAFVIEGSAEKTSAFSSSPGEMTPFVGRDAELGQMVSCFERLGSGLAQIVSVVGDAGIGKSRLVYQFKKRLKGQEVELLETRCSSLTRSVPYAPWVAMFRRWFGVESGDDETSACRKVAAKFTDERGVTDPGYKHLCWMLGLAPNAPSDESVLEGAFAAIERLLERTAEKRPIVIVIEDLHWLDDASKAVLDRSLAETDSARVMFVTTHRPDHAPTWRSNAAFTQLRLRPLPEAEAVRIISARAGGAVPHDLEKRILKKADGNPFYLEELTRALVEDGTLVAREGVVRATRSPDEIRIPDTIGELLGARIDRLSPAAKRVAQVASVLGRQFPRAHVEKLLEGEPIDVLVELGELERRGVLHRSGTDLGELRFGESLTQEVAYEGLLMRERRSLHDRAAALFEADGRDATHAGDGRRAQSLAAHHLARGEDRARGIEALIAAAIEAQALPSYGDSIRLYREAWELAETMLREHRGGSEPTKRLALRAAVGISGAAVVYGDSGSERDEEAAIRGIQLAEELEDNEALAALLGNYGIVVLNSGRDRFAEGVELIERGVAVAKRANLGGATPKMARGLVWAYLLDARFDEAFREVDGVVRRLEAEGHAERNTDMYLGSRYFRLRVMFESDRLEETEADAIDIYERATKVNNRTMFCAATSILANVTLVRGDPAKALEWAQLGLPVAEQIQNLAAARGSGAALILARADLGNRSAEPAELDRLERGLFAAGDLGINSDTIVEALLEVGELRRARRVADARVERSGGRLREVRGALMTGFVALAHGPAEFELAERAFGEALAGAINVGARSLEGRAHLGLAELAHARGEAAPMESHARRALAILRPLGFGRYAGRAAALMLERLEGAPPNA